MSSANISTHSRMKTVGTECGTEDLQVTVYTCPNNCRSHVLMLFVSNSGGNTTVDVEFDRADGTHIHILGGKNMVTGDYVQFTGGEMIMEPGDVIHCTPSGNASPHIDIMLTVEEFFKVPG